MRCKFCKHELRIINEGRRFKCEWCGSVFPRKKDEPEIEIFFTDIKEFLNNLNPKVPLPPFYLREKLYRKPKLWTGDALK